MPGNSWQCMAQIMSTFTTTYPKASRRRRRFYKAAMEWLSSSSRQMIGPKGNCRIHAAHLHYVCMYTLFEMLRVSAVVIHSEAACFLEESYREPSACRIHTSRENDQQACHIFFFFFIQHAHTQQANRRRESSRRRSAATVPMWRRSAGVTAVPHSTEVQGARLVARARAWRRRRCWT